MPRLELSKRVFQDFERILDHMAAFDVADPVRFDGILQALEILKSSPLIGRPVKAGKRELIIGRGARAYVHSCHQKPAGIRVQALNCHPFPQPRRHFRLHHLAGGQVRRKRSLF